MVLAEVLAVDGVMVTAEDLAEEVEHSLATRASNLSSLASTLSSGQVTSFSCLSV